MTSEEGIVAALRAIHYKVTWRFPGYQDKEGCSECGTDRSRSVVTWPCRTRALIDALEAADGHS